MPNEILLPDDVIRQIVNSLPSGRNRTSLASTSSHYRAAIPPAARDVRHTAPVWQRARARVPRMDVLIYLTSWWSPRELSAMYLHAGAATSLSDADVIIHASDDDVLFATEAILQECMDWFRTPPEHSRSRRRPTFVMPPLSSLVEMPRRSVDRLKSDMRRDPAFVRKLRGVMLPFIYLIIRLVNRRRAGLHQALLPFPTHREDLYNLSQVVRTEGDPAGIVEWLLSSSAAMELRAVFAQKLYFT